jgi:four helix bundle protein
MQHVSNGSLRVVTEMISLAREVGAVVRQVARHDKSLTDQMRRAWTSAAHDASEGQHQRGNKRLNRMCDAMGSARETRTAILLSEAYGYVEAEQALPLAARIDACVAQLYRLAHPRR